MLTDGISDQINCVMCNLTETANWSCFSCYAVEATSWKDARY